MPKRFARGRLRRARLVDRPNRFLVSAKLRGGETVRAFLPNPGRLRELFMPDARLTLEPASASGRRTDWTVLAVEREGRPVFLHTHRTNDVAEHLFRAGRMPGFEDAEVVRREVRVGRSRFDFLLSRGGADMLVEVKSCTLFGGGAAMFPDAVTERGRRHMLELAKLRDDGVDARVVFLVHDARVRCFMPDYHTDLAFSRTMLDLRDRLPVHPVSIGWNPDMTLAGEPRLLPVPWEYLDGEVRDRGAYLLLLRLPRTRRVVVGDSGERRFPAGWYVYVDGAAENLSARMKRDLRVRKRKRRHVDHLRAVAAEAVALPVRSSVRIECDMARAAGELFDPVVGFGSPDCDCPTHLFRAPADPQDLPAFHELLQSFRMRPPRM